MATFSDDFNRANENLSVSANWPVASGKTTLAIVSNVVRATATATDSGNRVATAIGNDQYARIRVATWGSSANNYQWTAVRQASAANTQYNGYMTTEAGKTSYLSKKIAGTETQFAEENATTWAANDTCETRAEGTAVALYRNGASLLSATDSAIASGSLAVNQYVSTVLADVEFDDFIGGDITVAPTVAQYIPPTISQLGAGGFIGRTYV